MLLVFISKKFKYVKFFGCMVVSLDFHGYSVDV